MPAHHFIDDPQVRRAFATLCGVVVALSFLKGFRLPNRWSATQFAVNYSHGFVRRGLLGELARQFAGDSVFQYRVFVGVALVWMLGVFAALWFLIRAALRSDSSDVGFRAAVFVIGASPALVFFVHSVGYSDYVGLLLTLGFVGAAARVRSAWALFYLGLGIGVVFALIHEALVVLFGPILMFVLVCHVLRFARRAPLSRGAAWAMGSHLVMTAALVFSLSAFVSTLGNDDVARVAALRHHVATHADYSLELGVFDALQRSSQENLTQLMPWYWSRPQARARALVSWLAFAPVLIWLICYGMRSVQRPLLPSWGRWMLRFALLGATAAPLLLNFVGWDYGRWNAIATLSCFVCIAALKVLLPATEPQPPMPAHVWISGAAVALVGLATTQPLFDGFIVQFFPFEFHWHYLPDLLRNDYRPKI